jgi:hypothetical protein
MPARQPVPFYYPQAFLLVLTSNTKEYESSCKELAFVDILNPDRPKYISR